MKACVYLTADAWFVYFARRKRCTDQNFLHHFKCKNVLKLKLRAHGNCTLFSRPLTIQFRATFMQRNRGLPTPRNIVLLEKLTVTQLVKKLSAFHGTRRFITVLTRACHWSLS
jgi:hypothetical protein